jgi:hypothetical protein
MEALSNEVRSTLRDKGFAESTDVGVPGFHVWPSVRTPGTVYVDVRLHRDRFEHASTPRWGKDRIPLYQKALIEAGFTVRQRERIPVPRLVVTKPAKQGGGPNHG